MPRVARLNQSTHRSLRVPVGDSHWALRHSAVILDLRLHLDGFAPIWKDLGTCQVSKLVGEGAKLLLQSSVHASLGETRASARVRISGKHDTVKP